MSDFWTYFNTGLKHVLDLHAYYPVLFLLALSVPYEFKAWKRLLILISLFTLGHTLALFLSVFNIVTIKTSIVGFLMPITILIAAVYNIVVSGKSTKQASLSFIGIVTLFFGLIDGLGFADFFNRFVPGKPTDKLLPLFESALGVEIAQIIVVIAALLLAYVVQTLLKFSKRDWVLIISAFIVGVVLPMILQSEIWVK